MRTKVFNIKAHADFKAYYDLKTKRNIWVLGYFGGGSVNISDAHAIARQFAAEIRVPVESVRIDEIFKSRRFKGFKYLTSDHHDQAVAPNATKMKDVWQWLTD